MDSIKACKKCGVLHDIGLLKNLYPEYGPEEADWDNRKYKDYDEFIKWECGACKEINQE